MIRNYFTIAWRNLIKSKAHSFINIAGLSVGLPCSLIILLWVQNERSIDAFHSKQLYTVYEQVYGNHKVGGTYNTPVVLADEMRKVVPEIEYAAGTGFGE